MDLALRAALIGLALRYAGGSVEDANQLVDSVIGELGVPATEEELNRVIDGLSAHMVIGL